MPSINRSTYMTPVQRGALPGGYDVMSTGPGTRAIIEFDPARGGLQRRIGTRPLYTDLVRQGCQPTGNQIGPPGYESDEYQCPFPIVGTPTWSQRDRHGRETVFGGLGTTMGVFTQWVVPAAVVIAVGALGIALFSAATTGR